MQVLRDTPPLTVEQTAAPQDPNQAVEASHTFTEMAKDYEFFAPHLITDPLYADFDRDPVAIFCAMHPLQQDGRPFAIDYGPTPFFEGFSRYAPRGTADEEVNWNHRIYAIVKDNWRYLRDFIGGIAFYHPRKQAFTKLPIQPARLVDPVLIKQGRPLNDAVLFPINVFAVDSTAGFYSIQLPPHWKGPSRIVRGEPNTLIEEEGKMAQEAIALQKRLP